MNASASAFLKAVLEASWQGSLVILLILLLRPLLGLRVPARWRYLLWSLVLLRLLVPAFILPPSPASLQNLSIVDRPLQTSGLIPDRPAVVPTPLADLPRLQGPEEIEASAAQPVAPVTPSSRSWWQIGLTVWLAGGLLTALWIAAGMTLLFRRVRRDASTVSEEIGAAWDACTERVLGPNRRRPRLIVSNAVSSPALVGLFRPALLLPREGCAQLSAEDWEHIFLHELAHYQRRDHWMQALQLVALCAHWFNPLVWLGFRYLRADRELAADEWTLRRIADRRPVAYGDTLLKMLSAQSPHSATPGLVGIMEDGEQMKQRLRHIVAFVPRRLLGSITGLTVVVALATVVLGQKLEPVDLSNYEGLTPAETLVAAARRGDEPAIKKMLADGIDINGVIAGRGERTALTAAVATHQLETVKLLAEKGADLNLKPEKADTPVIIALRKGDLDTAEYLRGKGATCDAEMLAAAKGDSATVQAYLQGGDRLEYDKVKMLGDIAAAHGHRALFAAIYDALKQLPTEREYFPYSRGAFVVAISKGHREVVEEILSRDPNLVPGDGVNRLAAPATRTPGMREWLATKGIKVPDYNDGERLIDAAERDDAPEIRRLLKAGVDVNYRGESDWTPISKATTWGCPRAVKVLLENGSAANPKKHGHTTLSLAKTPEIADLLFAAGAKPNQGTAEDSGDIYYCVAHGSKEMVLWFIDHGMDPAKVTKGYSPTLLFAAHTPEIIDLLVARGVDIRVADERGRTALISQLQMRADPAVIKALLKQGADPNARMKGGETPLMTAQDGLSVDALVEGGADLQAKDDRGNSVLVSGWGAAIPSRMEALQKHGLIFDPAKSASLLIDAVVLRRDKLAVAKLLAMGADPNAQAMWQGRPTGTGLSAAISNGEFEIAKMLREAGANNVGRLSEAAAKGDVAEMTRLLDAGASVDERTGYGATPLLFAVSQGQVEAVKLLLRRGANVNLFTATGYTAHSICRNMKGTAEFQNFSQIRRLKPAEAKPVLEAILTAIEERGLDPNYRNEAGETALMCGAGIGGFGGSEKGMDVNAQRPDGMTALMIAIATQPRNAPREGVGSVGMTGEDGTTVWRSERAGFVESLLKSGADVNVRNKDGKTALDLAKENGNEEMLQILNAKLNPPTPGAK